MIMCKSKWDKYDRLAYQNYVGKNLLPFHTFLPSLNADIVYCNPQSFERGIEAGDIWQNSKI